MLLATICVALGSCHGYGQTRSVVGTISAFKAETTEIEVTPDGAAPMAFKVTGYTVAQKVAPGVTDLNQVRSIRVTDIHLGDRVLATAEPGTSNLQRIVVMSAKEIAQRDEEDRADWVKRGVSGTVSARNGDQITLKIRTLMGEKQSVVTVTGKTRYKRYAPDSVKFADARQSSLPEIAVGDQVRARGEKNEDGTAVTAEEIVFGSFVTKAGTITSADAAAQEIIIKDLATGKPLTIRFTSDSTVKRMLDREGMIAMMHGTHEAGQAPMSGPMLTVNEMLERLPQVKLEDLKVADTVVVSSTRGTQADRVTAISLLANAELLLRMLEQMGSHGGAAPAGGATEMLSALGFGVMQ